ncbi:MAG: hypothetical protein SFY70_06860 [Bacteroidia bacterium]|nr:hypothetical protein [Bacteroidia bacterium]
MKPKKSNWFHRYLPHKMADFDAIEVHVQVYYAPEEGHIVAFCPSLDLVGSGKTEQEAEASISIVIDEYFRYTTNKKTLYDDLKEHGWTIHKTGSKFYATAPAEADVVERIPEFGEMLASKNYRVEQRPISIPVFA